jgi:hypothetical protein
MVGNSAVTVVRKIERGTGELGIRSIKGLTFGWTGNLLTAVVVTGTLPGINNGIQDLCSTGGYSHSHACAR